MNDRLFQVSWAMITAYAIPLAAASQTPQSASGAATPPGPSMQETQSWIKRAVPPMGSDYIVTNDGKTRWGEKYKIESAVLSDCILTVQAVSERDEVVPLRGITTVTLRDLDVEKILVREDFVLPGYTKSKPSYFVSLRALADRGEPFILVTRSPSWTRTKAGSSALVRVRDQDMAYRAASAFRRAALLCGAHYLPPTQSTSTSGRFVRHGKSSDYLELNSDGTFSLRQEGKDYSGGYSLQRDTLTVKVANGSSSKAFVIGNTILDQNWTTWERQADSQRVAAVAAGAPAVVQSPPSSGAQAATSRMTNDDVVKLVAAGLSEQVITTAIRQARATAFDLTPTGLIALKNARAPDAVILAMQEAKAPVPPVASSDAQQRPKYDPVLANPQPPTGPSAQDACSGIENMGLYKNDALPTEIGGGIVEWLAKIRNNSAVTKIVVFGWRDMYGQERKSQVQIPGGAIASPRLDLTQARVIPPVANLRVLSCQ